jgi:hypothetical protein
MLVVPLKAFEVINSLQEGKKKGKGKMEQKGIR